MLSVPCTFLIAIDDFSFPHSPLQTFRDVEWFPLLPEEETEESLEGGSEEEAGDDEVTESEPEIATRTRAQKKLSAATPPSSPATKEVATEVAASDSPKRKRSPSQIAVEQKSKRMKQTSILDVSVGLTRPLGPMLAASEAAGKGVRTLKISK